MNKHTKIASTDEAWEDGTLGTSAEHATAAPDAMQAAINASLGLKSISIRLPAQF